MSLKSPRLATVIRRLNNRNKVRWMGAAFAVWLVALAGGLLGMARFANTPGPEGDVPSRWPRDTRISMARTSPTLLMFAHPKCPCTEASIGELDRLMAAAQGRMAAHVIFILPKGTPESWNQTDLWRKAERIPGVIVHADHEGVEARRFHCLTSGSTLLYDAGGRLVFQGGITISRGHWGDSPGRNAILALLDGRPVQQIQTPAFGCPLFETECPSKGHL